MPLESHQGFTVRMRSLYVWSMYGLFAIVVGNQLLPIPEPVYVVLSSGGLLLFLLATLWQNRGFMQVASIAALLVGHGLLFTYGLGFSAWHACLTKGIFLPTLFVVTPLIAVPINNGGYLDCLGQFVINHRRRIGLIFFTLATINLALAIALNIASLLIFQKLLDPLDIPRKFLARLYMTVYGAYMLLSPYDPVVNMMLLFQGIPYSAYCLPAMLLVTIIMLIGYLLVRLDGPLLAELEDRLPRRKGQHSMGKLVELMGHVLLLIALAFVGTLLMPRTPTIFIVATIIVVYSGLWIVQVGAGPVLCQELRTYDRNFDGFIQFLPFLIALSFFGAAVSLTPIRDSLGLLFNLLHTLPSYLMLLSCMALVMVLSLCGIHMIIPVTTMALTIAPANLGLSGEAYVCLLMAAWVSGMVISPLVPFVVVVSAIIRARTTTVAYRWGPMLVFCWLATAPGVILGINRWTRSG